MITEANTLPSPTEAVSPPIAATPRASHGEAGGSRELLRLALPLILSSSFMTVQVVIDRLLLSHHNPDEVAASFPAAMIYWLGFGCLQGVAGYVSTFVAQYSGAGRPHRIGPAVWQGLHFAIAGGLLFLLVIPLAPHLVALGEHTPELQLLETTYLRCLCWAALPMLMVAAVNGFFSGRGQTWTVLGIDAFGTAVNASLALVLIFGNLGCPEMGIEGAGWATVAGSWASAVLALWCLFRPEYRRDFDTWKGWRLEPALFRRLLWYGGPAGIQMFLDIFVFTLFTMLVGRLGDAALGATSITVTFNMVAFLPMLGLAQAVCILVGQRLGENRSEAAEQTVYTGAYWSFGYMCLVAAAYLLFPHVLVSAFASEGDPAKFAAIASIVPTLLICVAIYSVADSANLTFAFALRGAGDTRFVTWLTFLFAWPVMVLPTYFVVSSGGSVYWCWAFATAHIIIMSICFWLRFRTGKWKHMRVIEPAVVV